MWGLWLDLVGWARLLNFTCWFFDPLLRVLRCNHTNCNVKTFERLCRFILLWHDFVRMWCHNTINLHNVSKVSVSVIASLGFFLRLQVWLFMGPGSIHEILEHFMDFWLIFQGIVSLWWILFCWEEFLTGFTLILISLGQSVSSELFSLDFHFAYSVDCIPLLDPDRRNGYVVLVFSQHFSFFETHKESSVWI